MIAEDFCVKIVGGTIHSTFVILTSWATNALLSSNIETGLFGIVIGRGFPWVQVISFTSCERILSINILYVELVNAPTIMSLEDEPAETSEEIAIVSWFLAKAIPKLFSSVSIFNNSPSASVWSMNSLNLTPRMNNGCPWRVAAFIEESNNSLLKRVVNPATSIASNFIVNLFMNSSIWVVVIIVSFIKEAIIQSLFNLSLNGSVTIFE